jgi:hypothetical protein
LDCSLVNFGKRFPTNDTMLCGYSPVVSGCINLQTNLLRSLKHNINIHITKILNYGQLAIMSWYMILWTNAALQLHRSIKPWHYGRNRNVYIYLTSRVVEYSHYHPNMKSRARWAAWWSNVSFENGKNQWQFKVMPIEPFWEACFH